MIHDVIILISSLVAGTFILFAIGALLYRIHRGRRRRRIQCSQKIIDDNHLVRKMMIRQGKVVSIPPSGKRRQIYDPPWPTSKPPMEGKTVRFPLQSRFYKGPDLASQKDETLMQVRELEDQPLFNSESDMRTLDHIDEQFGTTKPARAQAATFRDIGQDFYWQQSLSEIFGRERPKPTTKDNSDTLELRVSLNFESAAAPVLKGVTTQKKHTLESKTITPPPLSVWNHPRYQRTSTTSSLDSTQSSSGQSSKLYDVLPPLPLDTAKRSRENTQKSRPLITPIIAKKTIDETTLNAASISAKPLSGFSSYHFPWSTNREAGISKSFSPRSKPPPEPIKQLAELKSGSANTQLRPPVPKKTFKDTASTSPAPKSFINRSSPRAMRQNTLIGPSYMPPSLPLPHSAPPLPSFGSDSESSQSRTPSRKRYHKTPSITGVMHNANAQHMASSPLPSPMHDPRAVTSGNLSPISCSSGFVSDCSIRTAKRVPLFSPITKASRTPRSIYKLTPRGTPKIVPRPVARPQAPLMMPSTNPPPPLPFEPTLPTPVKPKSRPVRRLSKRTRSRSNGQSAAARDLQSLAEKALPSAPLLRSLPDYVIPGRQGDNKKETEIDKLSFHCSPFVVQFPSPPASP